MNLAAAPRRWPGWILLAGAAFSCAAAPAWDSATDRAEFVHHYQERFPDLDLDDFVEGVYAIDARLREQWLEIQDFPPYEFAVDEGRDLFETPFDDGSSYADCFGEDTAAIVARYPYVDSETGELRTLPLDINACRHRNGAEPLPYEKGDIAAIYAYLAYIARGQPLAVGLPETVAQRREYERGRELFHAKRGQLNFSCADCHVTGAGRRLREQTLMPLLGVVNRYPAYWLRWGSMGTLHQRFGGCMELVRAEPYPAQSREFRALEYFLAVMGAGLPITGPSTQR